MTTKIQKAQNSINQPSQETRTCLLKSTLKEVKDLINEAKVEFASNISAVEKAFTDACATEDFDYWETIHNAISDLDHGTENLIEELSRYWEDLETFRAEVEDEDEDNEDYY